MTSKLLGSRSAFTRAHLQGSGIVAKEDFAMKAERVDQALYQKSSPKTHDSFFGTTTTDMGWSPT